jgi:hypothetical protein
MDTVENTIEKNTAFKPIDGQKQSDASPQHEGSGSSLEDLPKPKGRAIQGVDYGLDLMDTPKEEPVHPQGQFSEPPHPQPRLQRQPSVRASSSIRPPQHLPPQPQHQQFAPHVIPMEEEYEEQPPQNQQPGFGFQQRAMTPPNQNYMPGFNPVDSQSDASSMGGGLVDNNMSMRMAPQPPKQLTYEEIRMRKTDALASLARLEQQGYVGAGKKGSHTTELDELEAMVEKLTAQRDLDNSIKFQRKILVGFATLMESVCDNEEYNIFELDLEGWSESLYENISEYDEVFEELYLKYKGVAKIPPEIKLISMVAGSAWMFHMSRSMFGKAASKVPGFDDVMDQDPELKKRYKQTATRIAQQRGVPVPSKKDNGMGFLGQLLGGNPMANMAQPDLSGLMNAMGGGQTPRPARPPPQKPPRQQKRPPNSPPVSKPSRSRVPMEEPHDIDGLLSGLTNEPMDSMAEDELDLSELENMSDLDRM